MKPVNDIRRDNLELLIREAGTLEEVASRGDTSGVYLSQVRNSALDQKTGAPRNLGAKMARRLEVGFHKPPGWMDVSHDSGAQATDSASVKRATSGLIDAVLELGARLDTSNARTRRAIAVLLADLCEHPEERAEIAKQIEALMTMAMPSEKEAGEPPKRRLGHRANAIDVTPPRDLPEVHSNLGQKMRTAKRA